MKYSNSRTTDLMVESFNDFVIESLDDDIMEMQDKVMVTRSAKKKEWLMHEIKVAQKLRKQIMRGV